MATWDFHLQYYNNTFSWHQLKLVAYYDSWVSQWMIAQTLFSAWQFSQVITWWCTQFSSCQWLSYTVHQCHRWLEYLHPKTCSKQFSVYVCYNYMVGSHKGRKHWAFFVRLPLNGFWLNSWPQKTQELNSEGSHSVILYTCCCAITAADFTSANTWHVHTALYGTESCWNQGQQTCCYTHKMHIWKGYTVCALYHFIVHSMPMI